MLIHKTDSDGCCGSDCGCKPKDHNYHGPLWTIAGAEVIRTLGDWVGNGGLRGLGGGYGHGAPGYGYPPPPPYGGYGYGYERRGEGDGCCHSCYVTKDVEHRDLMLLKAEDEIARLKAERYADKRVDEVEKQLCAQEAAEDHKVAVLQAQIEALKCQIQSVAQKEEFQWRLADCEFVKNRKFNVAELVCAPQCGNGMIPSPTAS